ncbi:MAG: glutathione synthase [Pseudomonadota bacterium]
MSLRIAFQMDPLEELALQTDSTIALAIEAQKRGCQLWHYCPRALFLEDTTPKAVAAPLHVEETTRVHAKLGTTRVVELADMDLVLIRQDPPLDMAYLSTTYILERLPKSTLVLNDPAGIRNAPEKLLPLQFPELIPPTLIAKNKEQILDFLELHKDIILKPLYEFGGRAVVRLQERESNISALIDFFDRLYDTPIIAQKFIPDVFAGDKRLLLVDGELIGGFTRVPQTGDIRSNMMVGGQPQACKITERDTYACGALKGVLQQLGLFFVGIDIVGEYLIEINVTSPTGIRVLNQLERTHVESTIWDGIEEKIARNR